MSSSQPSGDSPQQLLELALSLAKKHGATSADALFTAGRSTSVRVRLGETEQVKQSRAKGLGLRVFVGQAQATTSTSDLDPDALDALIRRTVEAAHVTAGDDFAGLPDPDACAAPLYDGDLELYDPAVAAFEADAAIALAKRAEAASLAGDPRLKNSEGGAMSWGDSVGHYANSHGLFRQSRGSNASLWTTPLCEQDGEMQRDYWWTSARHLDDLLSPEAVGAKAAQRALRRLGARKPETCQVPVIFDYPVASGLLASLAGALNGAALYKDASYLCGKLGESIATSAVTIVDDPHIRRGAASRLYDAEGLATCRTTIIEAGVLKSYILDTYTGRKLGLPSTRGARRGLTSRPSPGTSNLWMAPGEGTLDALIARTPRGLLITETFGFGVSNVTGDYSQGAVGLWIEDGAIAYPVNELTIASTLPTMWQSIDAIAADRDPTRGTSAPSFRVAEMTVAGN